MQSKKDILKAKRLLEELTWFLSNYGVSDIKKAIGAIDKLSGEAELDFKSIKQYESPNPNKHFLTGVLPNLFTDTSIFASNEDIAKFSEQVLKLSIPRADKKSKFELIGRVVCEINMLNDSDLQKLGDALIKLLGSELAKEKIRLNKKDDTFSWNLVIQELVNENANT